jgi:hypothetical protein
MFDSSIESPLLAARTAGALWLIVIVASIVVAVGRPPLDWRVDLPTFAAAATGAASSIRAAFAVNVLGKICYIGLTVLLYQLLKPVNETIAMFSAFCGLAGLMSGTGMLHDFTSLSILEESRRVAQPLANQLQTTAKAIGATHGLGMSGEFVFFAFQIGALGFLITRSRFIPRAIGVLLLLGGAGFLVTSLAEILAPAIGTRLAPLVLPIAALGEGSLALWLLVKGVDADQWQSTVSDRAAIDGRIV